MDPIRDLYLYEAWADAEHWRALLAFPATLEDVGVQGRLLHIHGVQRWYLAPIGGPPVEREELERPFASMPQMVASFRHYHEAAAERLEGMTEADYRRSIELPWFGPARPALVECMLQVILHGQYHRGQNATRLRELGRTPPATDYIVWVTKGRPAPSWP